MRKSVIHGLALLAGSLLIVAGAQSQVAEPDGATLFARYCASCHGRFGEGDGPVASVIDVAVPNLRTLAARSDGEFPRDIVMRFIDGRNSPLAHGDRLMPVWGEAFAEASSDPDSAEEYARRNIEAITDFVEQLQN